MKMSSPSRVSGDKPTRTEQSSPAAKRDATLDYAGAAQRIGALAEGNAAAAGVLRPSDILVLQRAIGNQAVGQLLCRTRCPNPPGSLPDSSPAAARRGGSPRVDDGVASGVAPNRSRIQRVVTPAEAQPNVTIVHRNGNRYTIETVQQGAFQGKPLGQVVKISFRDPQSNNVLKTFFSTNDDYKVLGGQFLRPPITEIFGNPDQYSFEGWFTYLAKEMPDGQEKEALITWALAYRNGQPMQGHTFDDVDKRAQLQVMLDRGFTAKQEAEMIPTSQAYARPYEQGLPGGPGRGYETLALPDLNAAGLVYRSDSRQYASPNPADQTIQKHGGSRPRSRLGDDVLISMNMDKAWNPFQDKRLRDTFLLRMASVDNDLRNVVSVAVDPRDSVKFPLPGGEGAGPGGTDTAHLYVIWTPKVMDTTKLIADATGAEVFGRGELGVLNIPANLHLIHIETQRFYQDHNVSYVAGKIGKVELLQPNERYMQLPPATRQGLFEVIELLHGGTLPWLIHRYPDPNNARHAEIEQLVEDDKSCTIDFPYEGQVIDASSYDVRVNRQPTIAVISMMVTGSDGHGKVLGNRWEGDGPNNRKLEWFKWDGYAPGTYRLTARVRRQNGSEFTTPARTVRYAPAEQASVADPRTALGSRLQQLRLLHGEQKGFISAPHEGEIITTPNATIRVEQNPAAQAPLNNITRVEVQIGTGGWQAMQGGGPWIYPWANYAPGAHDITARFSYGVNEEYVTAARRVTYVPSHDYEIRTPALGATLAQPPSTITVETDAAATNVAVQVSNGQTGPGTQVLGPMGPNQKAAWSFQWTGYGFGIHTVQATATNGAAQPVVLPSRTVRYPELVIQYPRQDEVIAPGPHYGIHATGADGLQAGQVKIRVWRDNQDQGLHDARKEANGWWYDLINYPRGYYKIVAQALNAETPVRDFRVR